MIYVSMLLSGGMPVSYIAAAFWFFTSYWCDKFELLTLSRRPITYGADLSNMVIERLPFAVVRLGSHGCLLVWIDCPAVDTRPSSPDHQQAFCDPQSIAQGA